MSPATGWVYSIPFRRVVMSLHLSILVHHDSRHTLHPVDGAQQDGCSEPNDGISDTPEQAEPDYSCQPMNSCPNRPPGQGDTDPINNYMVSSCVLPAVAACCTGRCLLPQLIPAPLHAWPCGSSTLIARSHTRCFARGMRPTPA